MHRLLVMWSNIPYLNFLGPNVRLCSTLGTARETKYYWPQDKCGDDGSLEEMSRRHLESGSTAYMSDELGLHRSVI